jgi:hypothetical protein
MNADLVRDINLPGWSDQSIWGYDPILECYWAQLWRDEDNTDAPRISISSYHLIPTQALLVRLIADALNAPISDVYVAMTT